MLWEKCSLWGLYLLNRGCFLGNSLLFKRINSTSVAFMNSFRSNQLQKPSLIMINIVAKPFWNMSIWTCFDVSSSQNCSEALKGQQVIWLPSGAIMFLSVWLTHCQSCETVIPETRETNDVMKSLLFFMRYYRSSASVLFCNFNFVDFNFFQYVHLTFRDERNAFGL